MEHLWIAESSAAALFQALRYAALKEINKHLSTLVSTYVRIIFAFPLQSLYLVGLLFLTGASLPPINLRFAICSALTAIGQFLGTAMMVRLFQLGNFAVGTMLTKCDVVLTALIGTAFFSEQISFLGWIAIVVTVVGVMVVSAGRMPATAWRQGEIGLFQLLLGKSTQLGLAIGLVNAVAYLLLKEAMLSLDQSAAPVVRAAYAGSAMNFCSVVILGGWLLMTERKGLMQIPKHQGLGWFLGVMSALGTIMWYLATVSSNASYVAAVAQVQVVFSLALSRYWFNERIRPVELAGIGTILAGVLMFRLV
jgi:drug/metabolite transporter (DMT)-like permease